MKNKWQIEKHNKGYKSFDIIAPDSTAESSSFRLNIDYDDVEHKEVDKIAKRIVAILNKHWDDSKA